MATSHDLVTEIASVCYEATRAICQAFGDYTQHSWREAEQEQRDIFIERVEFAMANPDASPPHDLPFEQHVKGHVFRAIVDSMRA